MKIAQERNGLEIKIWMMRNGIQRKDIENETGLNGSNVTRTINGERNCRAVLRYLLNKGCPVDILDLPADVKKAA